VAEKVTAHQHETYQRIHGSNEFRTLRSRHHSFTFAATVIFMAWYLLYVLMSSFAVDFMSVKLVGNINIALVFGLLQFASTFLIAFVYSRYADRQLDPIAGELLADYDRESAR